MNIFRVEICDKVLPEVGFNFTFDVGLNQYIGSEFQRRLILLK